MNLPPCLRHRGLSFYCHLLLIGCAGLLLMPLVQHQSLDPVLFGYSRSYFLYMALCVVALLGWLVRVLRGNRRANRRLLCALLIAGALAETVMVVIDGRTSNPMDVNRVPQPYVMFGGQPHAAIGAGQPPLNGLGFRVDRALPVRKPAGEIRVFVIGGSTVYHGSTLAHTIPGELQTLFDHDGYPQVQVYNFGAISYVSGQELSLFLHTVVDYAPDAVIVYDGGNDVELPFLFDPRPGYPFNFVVEEAGRARIENRSSFAQLLLSLCYHSHVVRRLFQPVVGLGAVSDTIVPIAALREQAGYRSAAWETAIVEQYIQHLDKMCHLAEGFHCQLAVCLQPLVYFKSPLRGHEPEIIRMGGVALQAYILRQYDSIRPRLATLQAQQGTKHRCVFVDVSRALDGYDRETFRDFIHIDDAGNQWMAQQIYRSLKASGWLTELVRQR